MKPTEQARQLTNAALEKLKQDLEAGHSDQLTAYLSAMARFHSYSFSNVMLICSQRPDATRVAGYKTWQRLGRQVRKGEKGIVIFAPMRIKRGDEQHDERNEDSNLRFRAVRVFDIAQTDGDSLPDLDDVAGDPYEFDQRLRKMISERDISVSYAADDELGGALGASLGGSILIREGLPPAEEFSVLVHELAHELLHKNEGEERSTRTIRETEAEAVAYIVGQAIGLQQGTASSDYIQLYDGNADTLTQSLERIRRTATLIIREIETADSPPNQEAQGGAGQRRAA
jgi:antirestriction protein ArdC